MKALEEREIGQVRGAQARRHEARRSWSEEPTRVDKEPQVELEGSVE